MGATLRTHYTRTSQIYLVYTLLTFDLQQYFKTSKQFPYPGRFPKKSPQLIPYYLYQIEVSLNTQAINNDNLFSKKSKSVNLKVTLLPPGSPIRNYQQRMFT